jgi:hypothetical protein
MEKETRLDVNPSEHYELPVKVSGNYTDMWGRVFGSLDSKELKPLPDSPSSEAKYFSGSIETPYGDFIIECEINEAKRAFELIADFVNIKRSLEDVRKRLEQAEARFNQAAEIFRRTGKEDKNINSLIDDLKALKYQLEEKLRIGGYDEKLKKYRLPY